MSAEAAGAKDLAEMRPLNEQLIERLGNERAAHAQSKNSLASALESSQMEATHHAQTKLELGTTARENEILSIRLEQLVDQLYELSLRNDALQEVTEAEHQRVEPH